MIDLYVLEFERTRIEFLKPEDAIKYAQENNIQTIPFEFKKELQKEELNPLM
jgi:hypothetical protein